MSTDTFVLLLSMLKTLGSHINKFDFTPRGSLTKWTRTGHHIGTRSMLNAWPFINSTWRSAPANQSLIHKFIHFLHKIIKSDGHRWGCQFITECQHHRGLTPVTASSVALRVAQRDCAWQGLWGMICQTVPASPAATVQIGDLLHHPSKWGSAPHSLASPAALPRRWCLSKKCTQ